MRPNNPFLITGYYSPEYFCDRKSESESIKQALRNGRNITLIAPRRMGKTGLIKNVFYDLQNENPEIVTLYMDVYSTQNIVEFIQLFANAVLGQLDTVPQKAMKRLTQFLKSCRPTFTIDEQTGMPKVWLDVAPSSEDITLKELFDYLQSSEKRCYIAIDEFQQIAEYPEKGIEALLRSYIQFLPNVNFIFSGSKKHVMQEMFLSAKRPFYQSTQVISIAKIEFNEYYGFASRFFEQQGRSMPEAVFSYLYNKFDGHTWYVQALLNRVYSYSRNIDEALVDYAINEIINESVFNYENLLLAYSANAVKLLYAVAKAGCVKEINSSKFIAQYKLKTPSSVNTSLKKLINNELIYKSSEGYIIYDRFMSIWMSRMPF